MRNLIRYFAAIGLFVTVVYILFHRRNVTKLTRQEILDIEKPDESTTLANTPFFKFDFLTRNCPKKFRIL